MALHQKASNHSRSPSKSRSRSTDNVLDVPHTRLTAKSPSPNPHRRASAVQLGTQGPRSEARKRSRSLRTKRTSNVRDTTPESPKVISHSLSVPDGDFHLVRNFSVTSKGVINRGDSFRSKSNPSSPDKKAAPAQLPEPVASAASATGSQTEEERNVPKYTVWLVGTNGVGKSSIRNQFMTSEYICQDDAWKDDTENRTVTVSLDGEETELSIEEYSAMEDKADVPDAIILVYSVTNRRSYLHARQVLSHLSMDNKAAILVANKTDLARLRTVTTVEGRSAAKEKGWKFIETSVAINHQLDELLVGIVSQIRIKAKQHKLQQQQQQSKKKKETSGRATCIIKRLWKKTCAKSKSCDNLHAL